MNLAIASASSPGAATALPPARAPLSASVQRRLEGYSYDGSYYYYSYGGNSCARGCPEEWRDDGVCDAGCLSGSDCTDCGPAAKPAAFPVTLRAPYYGGS